MQKWRKVTLWLLQEVWIVCTSCVLMCQSNFLCFYTMEFTLVHYPSLPPEVRNKCNQPMIMHGFSCKESPALMPVFFLEWSSVFQPRRVVCLADYWGAHYPASSGYWYHPVASAAHDLGPYRSQLPAQRPWLSPCATWEALKLLSQLFARPLCDGSAWLLIGKKEH